MKKEIFISLTVFSIIILISLSAGAAVDAETIGLGEDFSTIESETAFFSNPAGLALRENDFAVKANTGFSIWNNIFNNSEFTEDEIESKLTGEELIIAGRGVYGTQFYYKNFALGVNGKAEGMLETDSDATEILTADEPKITFEDGEANLETVTADFNVTRGGAADVSDISLSYAVPISKNILDNLNQNRKNKIEGVYFGAAYHYLEGDIYKFAGEGTITATEEESGVNYTISKDSSEAILDDDAAGIYSMRTEDGSASGDVFDLGMTVKWEEKYTFAVSIMNIGKLEADSYTIKADQYKADGDSLKESSIEEETVNESITYELPQILRLGGKMNYSESTVFYAEYSQVSYDIGRDDNVIALGSEFRRNKFIPLRLGLNYSSLREDTEISSGIGLNFKNMKINMGIADLGALFDDAKSVKFGLSSTLAF
ncbi:MAG: hypothetical protein ACOCQE_02235 [Halanaerobium sp.]